VMQSYTSQNRSQVENTLTKYLYFQQLVDNLWIF